MTNFTNLSPLQVSLQRDYQSFFVYYPLHTPILVKIVFKNASFIKQFYSFFLFTKILNHNFCPEKLV